MTNTTNNVNNVTNTEKQLYLDKLHKYSIKKRILIRNKQSLTPTFFNSLNIEQKEMFIAIKTLNVGINKLNVLITETLIILNNLNK